MKRIEQPISTTASSPVGSTLLTQSGRSGVVSQLLAVQAPTGELAKPEAAFDQELFGQEP